MRALLSILLCVMSPAISFAEQPSVYQSLLGDWAGYLEYRDYSEQATSTKRVQLPTWLHISQAPVGLSLHYIYDDGPTKVVDETEQLTVDLAHNNYATAEPGHDPEVYRVDGFSTLRDGRGTLVLTGAGTDNDKPSEQRLTLTIRRNMLEWLLEVRPAGSSEPFAFRHLIRLTRAQPPAVTAKR